MSLTNGVASVFAILSGYFVIAQGARSTPAATPAPGAEGWTVIGSKEPTPRNTNIRTPSNLAAKHATLVPASRLAQLGSRTLTLRTREKFGSLPWIVS